MDYQAILECQLLSMESKIAFPAVVQRLLNAGVDSYDIDLVKGRQIYFDIYNQPFDVPFVMDDLPAIGVSFDASSVAQVVLRSQRQEITYAEFIREIMKAGTCRYTVSLMEERVVYESPDGRFHVEPFVVK
ncbi:MAG: DUF1398 family protein [Candidatus Omnitrophica bacterium]|nr:DUF1398 family protein [Candidatus Omnitrophota bacterium]